MITEKQFLEAVDIIQQYQRQVSDILNKAIEIKPSQTSISEWIKSHPEMSYRLKSILRKDWEGYGDFKTIEYIEDMTKNRFLAKHNAGIRCWTEFLEIYGGKK